MRPKSIVFCVVPNPRVVVWGFKASVAARGGYLSAFSEMCLWRRVTNTYMRCGHEVQLREEEIRCESRWCRFSMAHPPDCVAPQCQRTCNQFRSFPQSYNPQIDNWCQACWESGLARR